MPRVISFFLKESVGMIYHTSFNNESLLILIIASVGTMGAFHFSLLLILFSVLIHNVVSHKTRFEDGEHRAAADGGYITMVLLITKIINNNT